MNSTDGSVSGSKFQVQIPKSFEPQNEDYCSLATPTKIKSLNHTNWGSKRSNVKSIKQLYHTRNREKGKGDGQ